MRTYLRRVNYYETDKMGVVHHSNYIRYFEEARTWFMEQVGYPYERLEREGIMSPVIGIGCEYKKPVRYPDTVAIDVHLVSMGKFRCAFRYEVRDAETGELRATGTSQHCYLTEKGGIVNMEKADPAFLAAFAPECEGGEKK